MSQGKVTDFPASRRAGPARVQGTAFRPDWVEAIHVNRSAAERRAADLPKRRTVKKEWQAAWLIRGIGCMDLTSLSGDDTPGRIQRLCAKAQQPVRRDLLEALGLDERKLTTAAVCVYHAMVEPAVSALRDTGIPVAAVSTGFPAGLAPAETRLAEIKASVAAGAREIDVVISRHLVLTGRWSALYDEVRSFREACGPAHLKVILAVGDLGNLTQIGRAAAVAMMAGADFIKTSTGMEAVNASLPVSLIMVRQIREFHERTGQQVGFKPAGGISTAKQALHYLVLMKEELGNDWLQPRLFRLGASRLLTDIERQLEHQATGRYSSAHRHPMG
ncbi:MAG: deoxyribose-phosphate aldolase [Rhodothalassiaceae bacterium]